LSDWVVSFSALAALFFRAFVRKPSWVRTAAAVGFAAADDLTSTDHVEFVVGGFTFVDEFHVFRVLPVVLVKVVVVPHGADGVGESGVALAEVPFRLVPAFFGVPGAGDGAVDNVEPVFVVVDINLVSSVVHFDAPVAPGEIFAERVLLVYSGAVAASSPGLSWEAVAPVVLEHFKDLPQRVFSVHLRFSHLDNVVVFPFF